MDRNVIRWGMIGCGDVTEVKSGPGFQRASGSELVAVMRRNGALARDYARRHQVARWYDDAAALVNDPGVDAVYIATPPSSHKDYVLTVAKAGKPIYVEKPMALNYEECQDMITACQRQNVPLFVAYYRRALPRFLKIKSLLEEGAIGQPRFVTVTLYQKPATRDLDGIKHWRIDPALAGCGYFCDLAPHMLDILMYYLGDISSATGFVTNQMGLYPAEDMVSAVFVFASEVHGVGTWNFTAYGVLDRTEIVGAKGKISFATFNDSPIVLENDAGRQQFSIKNPAQIQEPLIQTVVDELLGIGKCPSTGATAAQTNWVMDRILKNLNKN